MNSNADQEPINTSDTLEVGMMPSKKVPDEGTYLDDIKIICDVYSKYIGYYLTWFTWFFWINVIAIAVISNYLLQAANKSSVGLFTPIAVFFFVCGLFGLAAAVYMIRYREACLGALKKISEELSLHHNYRIDPEILIGNAVIRPVLKLILGSILLTMSAWVISAAWMQGGIPYWH